MHTKKLFWFLGFLFFSGILVSIPVSGFAFCTAGDKVEANWKGTWYPATVLYPQGSKCCIHYDAYASNWGYECVKASRIRGGQPSYSGKVYGFGKGDAVEVNWKGQWYPARVLKVGNGQWRIRYDGYSSSWDEWVGPDRIRFR